MDLLVIETGDGGELYQQGSDLLMIAGWQNMPYLALFGGNVEAVTKTRQASEQAFDWWGNEVLMQNDPSIQFNSLTERALRDTPLTSAGRLIIQQAVQKDLEFMNAFANVSVTVTIMDTNKVKIEILIAQPGNLNGRIADIYKAYVFIWDGTLQTLIGDFDINDFNDDFF